MATSIGRLSSPCKFWSVLASGLVSVQRLPGLGQKSLEGVSKGSESPNKNTAVPEKIFLVHKLPGLFEVGLFHEVLNAKDPAVIRGNSGLDVTVPRVGRIGHDPQGDKAQRSSGEIGGDVEGIQKSLGVSDVMIGRQDYHDRISGKFLFENIDEGQHQAGSGVSTFGFKNEVLHLRGVLPEELLLGPAGTDVDLLGGDERTNAADGLSQKRLIADKFQVLLWAIDLTLGPEAGSAPSSHDQSDEISFGHICLSSGLRRLGAGWRLRKFGNRSWPLSGEACQVEYEKRCRAGRGLAPESLHCRLLPARSRLTPGTSFLL